MDEIASSLGERCELEVTDPAILGYWNPHYLQRAIENLIKNAIKYGDPSIPAKITLSQTSTTATFTIHNKGHFITPADQQVIFNPFHRTFAAKTGLKKGWGIGLYVVKGVADAHGGTLSVDSSAELGTTFTLALPKQFIPF